MSRKALPRITVTCGNKGCGETFDKIETNKREYCSNKCKYEGRRAATAAKRAAAKPATASVVAEPQPEVAATP